MSASKSKYKARRTLRLAGQPMQQRETMPWFYSYFLKDFGEREKEQALAASKGPLSKNPLVCWGSEKKTWLQRQEEMEAAEEAMQAEGDLMEGCPAA